jgi:hypothetical protein
MKEFPCFEEPMDPNGLEKLLLDEDLFPEDFFEKGFWKEPEAAALGGDVCFTLDLPPNDPDDPNAGVPPLSPEDPKDGVPPRLSDDPTDPNDGVPPLLSEDDPLAKDEED